MAAVPNPTGVSSFTGRSDDAKGASVFEGLWQGGAFDSQDPAEARQLQEGRARDAAREANLRGEPAVRAVPDPVPKSVPQQQAPEALAQPEPVATEPAAAAGDEGPEYQDLDDYLTQAKIERDSFLTLPVLVKVDGKAETVPLKELMDGYSREGNYTRRSQELATKQRDWEGVQAKAEQAWKENLTAAQGLFQMAQQQLFADYQGLDQLKQTSPLDWAVKNQEYQQRLGQIQGHLNGLQNLQRQQEAQRQQAQQQTLAQEREKMLDLVPQWRDANKFKADTAEIQEYGRSRGLTDAELSQVADHRFMQILYDASQYRKSQAQVQVAAKRVRAAPQMSNPGTRTVRDPKAVAATQAKDAWKKSGYRDQAAGAAVFETFL